MKLTPSSTTRRSVAMAWSRLGGSPQMPGPVIRMAPNPRRLTVRSPPTSMVPAAAAVGCAFTRYLLLVLTVSLSCPPPARGRGGRNSKRRISRRRNNRRRNSKAQEQQGAGTVRRRNSKAQEQQGAGTARRRNSKAQKHQRTKDGSVAFLLAVRPGGRSALHRHDGLEVLRQTGRRRLLKVRHALQDFDRLHVQRVDLTMGVYAPERHGVFPRIGLLGDLDKELPALAQGHRMAQHLGRDDGSKGALHFPPG